MAMDLRERIAGINAKVREGRFDEAAGLAVELLVGAKGISGGELERVARALVSSEAMRPMFRSTKDAASAGALYERVGEIVERELPEDNEIVLAMGEKRAIILAAQGKEREAAQLQRRVFETLARVAGLGDQRTQMARSSLAIRLRNLGDEAGADALFAETGVCEHLLEAQKYVRSQGVAVSDVLSPWSENCRNWVYFVGVVLDAEALKKRFSLPQCVVVHSHLGTHDGAEQGLVCSVHHDALMGLHPQLARGAKVIS
jgi:hypothetical protein